MTLAEAVVDASVVVRGLTSDEPAAALLDHVATGTTLAHAPDLIVAEVANAFASAVRIERRSLDDAQSLLRSFAESPIELHPTKPLVPAAIEFAVVTGVSAYDAFYAVLARALALPLVTADRRLAQTVPNSVLVT